MQDLSFLDSSELQQAAARLQQAVEEIEYCLTAVQEEHDELLATNEMLKVAVQTLKQETPKPETRQWSQTASKEWQQAMNEILLEPPSEKPPAEPDSEPVLVQSEEEAKTNSFQAEEHVSLPRHTGKSYKAIRREIMRREVKRPSHLRRTKVVRC